MDGKQIGVIVILLLILAVIGILFYVFIRIRRKVRYYSRMLFGTESLVDGVKSMEREEELTPKSVSSATGLYLPSILQDFPGFHYEEMKSRAENVLLSYLRSIDAMNEGLLTEGTSQLRENLRLRIGALQKARLREHFEEMQLHRMEIYQYRRQRERCSIVFQAAIGYIHYVEKDGSITEGQRDRLKQSRYNIEMIYIQDRSVIDDLGGDGIGLNCPNCGAPISGVGAKRCVYCDSLIVEFNIKTWNFSSVKEV